MTTIHEVNPEVAKELGLSQKIVEQVNKTYWQAIHEEMENPTTDCIRIEGFGTFYISPKKVIMKIVACYSKLRIISRPEVMEKHGEAKLMPFRHTTINKLRHLWSIKDRFAFRMTDGTWKYVNMQVGYIRHKSANKPKQEQVIDEEENDDSETNAEDMAGSETGILFNLDF